MPAKTPPSFYRKGVFVISFPCGCNLDCVFCRRNEGAGAAGRLTPGERPDYGRLGRALALLRKRGVEKVNLGGDEPTLAPRRVLDRVLALCRAAGFKQVELSTNGLKLADPAFARWLRERGVNVFLLPVYGDSPAVHDAVTGRRGSYRKLLRAVENVRALRGALLTLHTVLLRQNEAGLPGMRRYARSKRVNLEVERLQVRPDDAHVDHAALAPGAEPGRRGPRRGGARALFLRYNLKTGRFS